jgi:hypothetical protein
VSSWDRTGRVARIAALGLVTVVAFAAGVALRAWSAESRTVAPTVVAQPLDADSAVRPIRLVRADPGRLRPPAQRVTVAPVPGPAPLPPAPVAVAPPPGEVAPPPTAPQPSAPVTGEGRDESQQQPPADNAFDLEG